MTGGRPWTADEESRLRDMIEAGINLDKIAKQLGRTEQAIINRCYTLRIGVRGELKRKAKIDPVENFFLNGEPLTFAVVDRPCARCAVRESVHHEHGCGQFAAEVRVRIK